ncbi:hypothetical protein, partial [Nostoc sp. UCD120]|uniref:hypothetical protein n=1 Tax=Nostoc sp. UCD120 TaxID=2681312 RepID=UPI001C8A6428
CRLGRVKHNPTLPPNFMLGYAIAAPSLQNLHSLILLCQLNYTRICSSISLFLIGVIYKSNRLVLYKQPHSQMNAIYRRN